MAKVLVLGGGFAGVESAIFLREQNIDVTLVSDRDYFYIYPTSIWIPTGDATTEDVSVPLSDLAFEHDFEVIVDEVISFEAKDKKVTLKSGRVLDEYEFIVVALGQDKIYIEGMEHTLSICGKPQEAVELHKRLTELIQKGSGKIAMGFGGNPKDPSAVRGGPAFEVLFNVHNYLKKKGIRDKFELTFFAPMENPGARMGKNAVSKMKMIFVMMNLKSHYGKKIKEFQNKKVVFEDNSTLEADLIVFVPANQGHKNMVNSDLPLSDAGFIEINEFCQVNGFENIFAVGDVAKLEGADWRAKQGHIAEVMARNSAENIIIKENDLPKEMQSYLEHINILCVMDTGNGAAFVYRDDKSQIMFPLPWIGHWLKKGWGYYAKWSKLGYIPRLPGM